MLLTGEAWCACFSPDATQIASTSRTGAIHIWQVDNGAVLTTLEGKGKFGMSIAYVSLIVIYL
jgi:WD40 repeat protein